MLTRRRCGVGLGGLLAAGAMAPHAAHAGAWPEDLSGRFGAIEARTGGRLGVGVLDAHSGRRLEYRGDERFPLCSTYKALAAAAVLARADRGAVRLDRRVRFGADRLISYSPGTKAHADADGMTLAAICEAAVTLSDNTAGNLMLDVIGGPAGLTAFLRGLGDAVTRLDRTEPTLNEALPGDPRDTTSPAAMAADLNRLALGQALSPASRRQFAAWLAACTTGDARLRAGVPPGWRVGDKTGTGDRGTANDAGVLWPPGRGPVAIAVFITGATAAPQDQSAAIAHVARAVVAALPG